MADDTSCGSWSVLESEKELKGGKIIKEITLAPDAWIDGNVLKYPNYNRFALSAAVENCEPVKEDWPSYRILRFFRKEITDFIKAKAAMDEVDSEMSDFDKSLSASNPVAASTPADKSKKRELPLHPRDMSKTEQSDQNCKPNNKRPRHKKSTEQETNGTAASNKISSTSTHKGSEVLEGDNVPNPSQAQKEPEAATTAGSSQAENRSNLPLVEKAGTNVIAAEATIQRLLANALASNKTIRSISSQLSSSSFGGSSNGSQNANSDSEDDRILAACPLKSMADFDKFDKRLRDSQALRKQLRKELKIHITENAKKSAWSMAKSIFTDDLAQEFSWKGQISKRVPTPKTGFITTKVSDIIFYAVNRNFPEGQRLTLQTYQDALANWFTQARFRKIRRVNRAQKRAQQMTNQGPRLSSDDSDDDDH